MARLSLIIAILTIATLACAPATAGRERLVIETAKGSVHVFSVEVADTDEKRRIGLMYREELAPDAGMLFDFGRPPKMISMWMKNTLIPLDMAFIDENGIVRHIAARTTPLSLESIPSRAPVIAVLEVNGGALEEREIRVGDRVRHRVFQNE